MSVFPSEARTASPPRVFCTENLSSFWEVRQRDKVLWHLVLNFELSTVDF